MDKGIITNPMMEKRLKVFAVLFVFVPMLLLVICQNGKDAEPNYKT